MEKQATLKEQPTGRSLYVEHDELRGRAIKDAVRERDGADHMGPSIPHCPGILNKLYD